MKNYWQEVKVGDIGEVVGGGTPSTKCSDYYGGDIPWITPKDLSNFRNRYISRGERMISKLGLENSSAKMLPPFSVLFTSRAPLVILPLQRMNYVQIRDSRVLFQILKNVMHYFFIIY